MKTARLPPPRGQNVVLLALMMLFMVLMVTMTVGLGLRIREQHELQNLADAAAYSSAVEAARAFNSASLLNRVEVSMWVAQAADQALISWTGYANGMANASLSAATWTAFSADGCRANNDEGGLVRRAVAGARATLFNMTEFDTMDNAAGRESQQIQGQIAEVANLLKNDPNSVQERLYKDVHDQKVAKHVVSQAGLVGVSVVEVPPAAVDQGVAGINRRELDCDYQNPDPDPPNGAPPPAYAGLCKRGNWSLNMLQAAMGSRGNPWVTQRGVVPSAVQRALTDAVSDMPYATLTFSAPRGNAYWADAMSHGASATLKEAWADDHDGPVTLTVRDRGGVCSSTITVPVSSYVRSTHLNNHDDAHGINPGADDTKARADKFHTMGTCEPHCPSVWVMTPGFMPSDEAADAFGQPKQVVALERDQGAHKSWPWELHFNFPFSATGPVRGWDARGQKLHTGVADGLAVQHNVAVSTGMAYYHRRDHWEEFPNLLNPFWRATLVPVDVDPQGKADLPSAIKDPKYKAQRDAYKSLLAAGYEGLH